MFSNDRGLVGATLNDPFELENYHPNIAPNKADVENLDDKIKSLRSTDQERSSSSQLPRWLPRLGSSRQGSMQQAQSTSLRNRLSRKMARLASLDSTRSSSSVEVDTTEAQSSTTMPIISVTSNGNKNYANQQYQPVNATTNRYQQLSYSKIDHLRRTQRLESQEEEEDEEDDEEDYITSSRSAQELWQGTNHDDRFNQSNLDRYEDLLDDRQGMNDGEQQFTKGERMNRPSIDGSIISDLRSEGKKSSSQGGKGGNLAKKDKQQRSKSPSSSSFTRSRRHSKRGFLGLASRLKLTRKHQPIARLQLSVLNSGFVSLKALDRDLQTYLPKERMTPKEFQDWVKLMRKYEVLVKIEYRFASKSETYVCRHAAQELNQVKNNNKKCIPYDYNRVVLKTLPNIPDSDYINASHVDSCLKPNAYIAAQGPNENTIEDFWRMIWEQKTFVVIMLTKVFDFIRVMCNQYWPVECNKPERYGDIEVTLLYEEPLADFVIRTIRLSKSRKPKEADNREVSQGQTISANGEVTRESATDEDMDENCSYSDEDSSASEELLMSPESQESNKSDPDGKGLPRARSPRFVLSQSRSKSRQSRSTSRNSEPNKRANSDEPSRSNMSSSVARASSKQQGETNNKFLHPLFSKMAISASSGSIPSTPNTPLTPMTPRTPSSAGIDRSSATRRAVKKKRRARVKNTRPVRTQFKVPDESQLVDDDDGDDDDEDPQNGRNNSDQNEEPGTADDSNGGRVASNERIIYQFHYNSWYSHTCPSISSLLHFRRRVRICMDEMSKSGKTGPTVVHCNDGCGRTGAYLNIDANLELAEEDNVFDVYQYAKKMRLSRRCLIESLEQYRFVYDTIEESLFCGKTWFPVSELHKRLKHKSQRNPITKKNEYQREYERITRMTSKFSIGDCAGGHRVENREKNRDVSTVPPDNFRPYLTSFQSNDNTDYINAVFVDGYTRSKEYIVTEWPTHKTISDFWSLIYDHDCNSVILLANPGESSTYPSFLPSEKELRRKFGPVFSAEMVSYTHYQNIKSWIYTINKKIVSLTEVIAGVKSEAKTTQVFQITCWPQGHRVPTSTNALVELMNMVERWRQRTTYGPVCVVSLNGKSRAGVYCAANVAIEQVVQHSEVDVFQAVKTVRRHRPQLIENMTEYKYCYDLILHYVLHYVNQGSANN